MCQSLRFSGILSKKWNKIYGIFYILQYRPLFMDLFMVLYAVKVGETKDRMPFGKVR